MNTTNAFDNSLEELVDQMVNLVNLTDLQDFLKLSQEQGFFDAIGEWPVLQETFQKWNCKSSILSEEEHRASQKLLIELRASLNLVEWNDNVLEEDDMFVSKWNSETTDNTCKDVKKFGSTVELVSFVDKGEEALIDSLSNHLSSWNQLRIKLMQNVLQVVSFYRLFRIEKF